MVSDTSINKHFKNKNMSKSKLEILLDVVLGYTYVHKDIADAYQAYMEERKTLPQAGQEIEVRHSDKGDWLKREFVAMSPCGRCIAYNKETNCSSFWNYYRIPTPKKKWKVVKTHVSNSLFIIPYEQETDCPIITTFED
jgi:hypothetical protein